MKSQKVTLIILSILLVAMAAYVFILKPSTGNIAYVETGILLQDYEGMKKASVEFEAKSKELSAGADSLIAKFQEELKLYEASRKKLSKKEQELKEELLRVRQQQISNYHQSIQKKIAKEEQTITQTHVNTINEFLKEYGEQKYGALLELL